MIFRAGPSSSKVFTPTWDRTHTRLVGVSLTVWRVGVCRQQQYGGGGHGWDRAVQSQQSAYQQNMSRGRGGGGYQQRYDRRDDRRDGRGSQHQVQTSIRGKSLTSTRPTPVCPQFFPVPSTGSEVRERNSSEVTKSPSDHQMNHFPVNQCI